MSENKTPTPRTDDELHHVRSDGKFIRADFARTLERELSEAMKLLEEARATKSFQKQGKSMIIEFICPNPDCESDLRVPEGSEWTICPACNRPVKINYDADYVDGRFVDRTTLCLGDI